MTNFKLLGDPHLGKDFRLGVPSHRRGEREASQWAAFEASLNDVAGVAYHINMGDLFDSFQVSNEVVLRAAQAYLTATRNNPEVIYFIILGNHDARREAGFVSSFDLFSAILAGEENIVIVRDRPWIQYIDGGDLLLCPWDPFKSATEMLASVDASQITHAFGHWDLETFGGEAPHNLLPYAWFADRPHIEIYTGHIHKREVREINGITVNVVGSMQPYAHGEGDLYVTLTLAELEANRDAVKDRVVRLVLQPGEVLEEPVDCLQFSVQRVRPDQGEEVDQVELGEFDLKGIFDECFKGNPLAETVWAEYEKRKNAA
ncbi:metallophosphoesterase [Inquilinus limosus]|uniref:Calcineurin-like phosphoesterase domain-containing protein n=1 Tax=Inquilinus limosus MP06 TaxID=1398085 RepID=A0A0A0DBK8_9PROT|nr:metallophosphoesterase [Inquilinus limosus]KGM36106.1 hypothetical protein P409_00195 [Inquilinus limosus MP06]